MANTTIYPYGTDGQLPSDIGVINDLTTGGADKALSAQQGVVIGNILGLINVTEGAEYVDVNIKYSEPVLTVSESSLMFNIQRGTSATATFTVSGVGLAGDLSIVASGTGLSVNPQTIQATEGVVAETTVTVTFAPTETGTVNGSIIIGDGGTSTSINVVATATGAQVTYNKWDDTSTYIEWEDDGNGKGRIKDFLPCSNTLHFEKYLGNGTIFWYNSDKTYVGENWLAETTTMNVPSGAAYFKFLSALGLSQVAKQYTTGGPWLTGNSNGTRTGGYFVTYA